MLIITLYYNALYFAQQFIKHMAHIKPSNGHVCACKQHQIRHGIGASCLKYSRQQRSGENTACFKPV